MPAIDVDVVRSLIITPELRADRGSGTLGVLGGHFSVFNHWYRVSSMFEGDFVERTAPGMFAETLVANRESMRAQFDHGFDAQIGNKSLGGFRELREDETGGYYEIDLDDTSYNRDLLPGFKRGAYGSSFRMMVLDDIWDDHPARSEYNPEGRPERTILRADVMELGPVAWPASSAATAKMRSDTDVFYNKLRSHDPGAFEAACRAANISIPDFAAANPQNGRSGGSEHDSEPGKAAQSQQGGAVGAPAASDFVATQQFSQRRKALHWALKKRGIV